jgi:hypothetical protein
MQQRGKESGAVLVFALVFMLATGLLALTGMENAVLESRMATGSSIQEKVLSMAEQGLKLAEQAIVAEIRNGQALDIDDEDIFYPVTGAGSINPLARDWSVLPYKGNAGSRGIQYVIEYAGPVSIPATDSAGSSVVMEADASGDAGLAYLFVITSRAELNGSVRLVRSVYASASAP